jgi:hypothetical protein
MCKKRNSTKVFIPHQKRTIRVDECIAELIKVLNNNGFKTLGSCCGHGLYPLTIIVEPWNHLICPNAKLELGCNKYIPRAKKFYSKDKNGFYFIPENKVIK